MDAAVTADAALDLPADATTPASAAAGLNEHPFEFHGTTGEYFRIWIVNLALSIATLGIYSAWAKVRRERYFHGNTRVAGSAFAYHGEPKAILKGRAIAVVLLVTYVVAGQVSLVAGAVVGLLLFLALPFLIVRSLMFRLQMTSWRGLRFHFRRDYLGSAAVMIGWLLAASLTLGLLLPRFLYERTRFVATRSSYGATPFGFGARSGPWFKAGAIAAGILLLAGLIGAYSVGALGMAPEGASEAQAITAMLVIYGFVFFGFVVAGGYVEARTGNATYNSLTIGAHRFASRLSARRLIALRAGNLLAIVATLGLAIPWAAIRIAKYRLESLSLLAVGELDEFVAAQRAERVSAGGEAVSEVFDVDVGL
jgi:uncharacterized membrane protein YjgN (DUF898 family)